MVVGLLGYVFVLFAVAGLEKGIQEAVADENSTEQAAVQEEVTQGEVPVQETAAQQTPAQDALAAGSGEVAYSPDYEIGLFSHKAHVNGAGLQCTACHTGIFQQAAGSAKSTGSFNMAAFGEGKYCGTCHNGSTAFTVQDEANCRRCHGSDVNPPDTILLEKPVKAVIFDHALHNKELGLACNECHMSLFEMKTGSTGEKSDFNMEAMYNGKYCGACHNGSLAFDVKTQCAKCHIGVLGNNRATSGSGEKKAAVP